MADDTQQQPQQPPADLNAAIQALIQQQIAAATGRGQQVQLPSTTPPPSQYSNDPSKGPDLLERVGLALGGGALPGAPAELQSQMGRQGLLNFGIGLMSAGKFATPGEVFAGGLRGAQSGLLGSEAAQAGQQEYALNAQTKLAELGLEQQKDRTAALTALVPLLQMQGRLGQPLFGPGSAAGPPGGGGGDDYAGTIQGREGLTADPRSSAVGGFINSTWQAFAAANPDLFKGMTPEQVMAARSDPKLNATAINWVAQQNAKTLQGQGITPTGPALGIAHYLGAGGAAKVLGAPDTDPVSKYVSDAAVKANPELGTMTVGQLKARYANTPSPGFLTAGGGRPGTAPPPASGPGSAPTTSAGPPGVQMGGPPPAPPGGPAGGAVGPYTGGGIGSALNPNAPPATVAAPAGGDGKRADVGAMLQGIQTAQATPVVRGTGEEAGPSGAVATLASPPAAEPGWGSQVGTYNLGPVTAPTAPPPAAPVPSGAVTPPPPAPTPTPPATPAQPSRHDLVMEKNPDGTYKMPDDQVSQQEFLDREHHTYSPQELQDRGVILPDNPAEAQAKFAAVQKANEAADAARRAAAALYGTMKDPSDAIKQLNAANEQAQKARQDYATYIQGANEKNGEALQKIYQQQDDRNAAAYKTQVTDPKAAAALAAAKLNESEVGSANQVWQQAVEAANKKAGAARGVRDQLEPVMGMIGGQPTSAFIRNLIQNNPDAAVYLKALGITDPDKVDAATAIRGILGFVGSEMKPTGTGALREYEFNAIRSSIGSGTMSLDQQRLALARVLNLQDRIMQEADKTGELWQGAMGSGNPRNGLGSIQKNLDAELGPVIHDATKEMPRADLADPGAVTKWLQSGVVPSGRPVMVPVYNDDGTLRRTPSGQIETKMRVVQ